MTKSQTSPTPGIVRSTIQFFDPVPGDYEWPHCEITGAFPGPRLCVSAGVHVNEVSGIEAAIRLQSLFDPARMHGSVSIIPVMNQPARFQFNEYICPVDGKNINFSFPGNPDGTFTEILCDAIMRQWTAGADCYVDLHGGDLRESMSMFSMYQRTDDPQFDARARQLAQCFDAELVVGLIPELMEQPGRPPTAFAREKRFSIMSEAGSNGIVDETTVAFHIGGVLNIARMLGILRDETPAFRRDRIHCEQYIWVPTEVDGEFQAQIKPGQKVSAGQPAGIMRNLFGETVAILTVPIDGYILWCLSHPTIAAGTPVFAVAVPSDDQ